MYNCPDCNESFDKGTTFCQQCGCNIEQKFIYEPICPQCHKSFDDGTQFCDEDGAKLTTADQLVPTCVECGKSFDGNVRFCPDDGGSVLTKHQRAQDTMINTPVSATPSSNSEEELLERDYQVNIGDAISGGFDLLKQNMGGFIGFTFLLFVINIILSVIPLLGTLASMAVNPPLMAGFYLVAKKILNGEETEFADFFSGFTYFLPLFLASLVTGIFVFVGLLLFIIPGIYLSVAYFLTPQLIINRKIEFFDAMELSRKLVTKHWFGFFGFSLVITIINIIGFLLLGFGVLFTFPLTMCAFAYLYHDIVNKQLG